MVAIGAAVFPCSRRCAVGGTVDFDVVKPKLRCLATHANPKTGERDLPILTTLTRVFGQEQPTFAVAMVPSHGGGRIHAGDEVSLVD